MDGVDVVDVADVVGRLDRLKGGVGARIICPANTDWSQLNMVKTVRGIAVVCQRYVTQRPRSGSAVLPRLSVPGVPH